MSQAAKEMHLSIQIETMRREGCYEFQVSTPRVRTKVIDGDAL